LIDEYGKTYRRRTQLTTAEEIDVRELTANELAVVYDRDRGLLGTTLKGEAQFRCSPLDRTLVVWDNGRFQVMPPPDRLFVDKNVVHVGLYQRDRVYTVVYSTARGGFIKRFAFGGAIMNRDYFCIPPEAKIKFLSDQPVKELRLRYRHIKGARIDEQSFNPAGFTVRSPRTRGNQVTKRTISSVVGR
jgi:topoisomerase IV subunit A